VIEKFCVNTMVFLFFDTNVIQNLNSFGEFIFDNYLSGDEFMMNQQEFGLEMILELDALRQIMFVFQRGSLPVAISAESLKELCKTPNTLKRDKLVSWGLELLNWWRQNRKHVKSLDVYKLKKARRLAMSKKLSFLKDFGDRLLIAEALILGCDTFLTFDRKTILTHKKELAKIGIDVLSPREFVDKYQLMMSGA